MATNNPHYIFNKEDFPYIEQIYEFDQKYNKDKDLIYHMTFTEYWDDVNKHGITPQAKYRIYPISKGFMDYNRIGAYNHVQALMKYYIKFLPFHLDITNEYVQLLFSLLNKCVRQYVPYKPRTYLTDDISYYIDIFYPCYEQQVKDNGTFKIVAFEKTDLQLVKMIRVKQDIARFFVEENLRVRKNMDILYEFDENMDDTIKELILSVGEKVENKEYITFNTIPIDLAKYIIHIEDDVVVETENKKI
ncbi:hypothetical protein SAMN04487944_101200 [Gracilibacillus ureilyticus]|uniref:Uncharacterized protein n=1 Tax=Gracilibacillus ureilyticus TaxID=531814 RepID=A0A1H9LDG5_9BACI|nr:hypothetical protein [Gracilibacillus ureilyticus]SER09227.1 hypothetical protein SAMN04487944_101200 [Gracilibacillus ureilyticus]